MGNDIEGVKKCGDCEKFWPISLTGWDKNNIPHKRGFKDCSAKKTAWEDDNCVEPDEFKPAN